MLVLCPCYFDSKLKILTREGTKLWGKVLTIATHMKNEKNSVELFSLFASSGPCTSVYWKCSAAFQLASGFIATCTWPSECLCFNCGRHCNGSSRELMLADRKDKMTGRAALQCGADVSQLCSRFFNTHSGNGEEKAESGNVISTIVFESAQKAWWWRGGSSDNICIWLRGTQISA